MKRTRYYIFGAVLALLAIMGWWAMTHAIGLLGTVRDVRLGMAGFEKGSVRTDSAEVHYYRGGTGKKTVLLIHGFGVGGATTWFDAMLSLDDDIQIIVPDLVWFGESEGSMRPNLPNQARTLWQLCDSLHVKPDALVGISYGGFVSFEMLHQRPEGAKQLVIVNSPGPVFQQDDIRALCARAEVDSPDELFIPKDENGLKHLFRFVFSSEPPIPDFIYDQIFNGETQKNAETKRLLMRDLVDNADLYRVAGFPKTKNGVIWSRNDQVFPLACGERLADSLRAEMVVLENSGHVPHPGERERYMAGLRKFLLD